jgi:hypothetical protein
MKKQQVIELFCKLAERVSERQFGSTEPTDCFCGKNPMMSDDAHYQFSEKVMDFIEMAVSIRLDMEHNQRYKDLHGEEK